MHWHINTYAHHTQWKISLHMTCDMTCDLQQGRWRLTGSNISECLNWSVKISITVNLSVRQATILCPLDCNLFSFTHRHTPSSPQFQKAKEIHLTDLWYRWCIWVIIEQHFLLTNIQILTRNSECYLKRDYHRMLWNSPSCLETESQSFSFFIEPRGTSLELIAVNPIF